MIRSALGVGETWLNEAIDGYTLVRVFGPNGSHPAPSVVDTLQMVQDKPSGRALLLKSLQAWGKEHPIH